MKSKGKHFFIAIISAIPALIYCCLWYFFHFIPFFSTKILRIIKLIYAASFPVACLFIFIIGLTSLICFITNIKKKKKQSLFTTSGLSITCSFLIGSVFLTYSIISSFLSLMGSPGAPTPSPNGSDQMKFNSQIWKDPNSKKWIKDAETKQMISIREKMLKDLLDNVLPGKTKEEIEDLLGPSLKTQYFSSYNKDFIYYLGPERNNSWGQLDSEWLLIWLDKDDKFEKYRLWND